MSNITVTQLHSRIYIDYLVSSYRRSSSQISQRCVGYELIRHSGCRDRLCRPRQTALALKRFDFLIRYRLGDIEVRLVDKVTNVSRSSSRFVCSLKTTFCLWSFDNKRQIHSMSLSIYVVCTWRIEIGHENLKSFMKLCWREVCVKWKRLGK